MATINGNTLRATPTYISTSTANCFGDPKKSSRKKRHPNTEKLKEALGKKNRERDANQGYNPNIGVQITDDNYYR